MSKALLLKIKLAQSQGADLKAVLSDMLHQKCSADGRVSAIAFGAWATATLVFLISVAAMILGDSVKTVPLLSALSKLQDAHLQTIAASCAVISSVLFMTFLRLRQEQTKHTFLLIMVLDGSVREAASLLFGGGVKEGKAGFVADATDFLLDNVT